MRTNALCRLKNMSNGATIKQAKSQIIKMPWIQFETKLFVIASARVFVSSRFRAGLIIITSLL